MSGYATWRVLIHLNAVDMTSPAWGTLLSSIRSAHSNVTSLNTAVTALRAGAAYGLAEFGKAGVGAFLSFANSAGELQKQLIMTKQSLGATADEMARLSNQQLDLISGPNRVLFSQTQVAGLQRGLAQSGLSAKQVLEVARYSAYAGELENMRIGTQPQVFAQNIGSFLRGYKLYQSPERMNAFVERFSRISSVSKFDSQSLRILEMYFGNVARNLRLKESTVIDLAGYLSQLGFRPSTIGTGLMNMFMYSMPRSGAVTRFSYGRALEARIRLGWLNPVNPVEARRYMHMHQAALRASGLSYFDPSHMTASQQDAYAKQMLAQSMTSKLFAGKSFEQIASIFEAGRMRYEKRLGRNAGDQAFMADLQTAANMRGGRTAAAFDVGSIRTYLNSIARQKSLPERIAELRQTLPGLHQTMGAQWGSISAMLGGVDPRTQRPIPGGPLDIVSRVLSMVTKLLDVAVQFGKTHRQTMAMIGTLVGVLGVAGLAGAAAFAVVAVLGLTRALWGLGGSAVLGAAFGPTGRAAGFVGNALMWGPRGLLGGLFGRVAGRNALGQFTGAGRMALWGRAPFNITAMLRGGMAGAGGALGGVFSVLARFIPLILRIGLRFLGIVGWVLLVIDILKFFKDHPKDIEHWIATIIVTIKDKLIPWTVAAFEELGRKIVEAIKSFIMAAVAFIRDPMSFLKGGASNIAGFFKGIMDDVRKQENDMNRQKHHVKEHSRHGPGGHQKVSYYIPITVQGHADRRTVAELVRRIPTAVRSSSRHPDSAFTQIPGYA